MSRAQPLSFGSRQYWENRFTSNSLPFEWLEAPEALDPYLVAALRATGEQNPKLLHIGCGTSLLAFHLRAHVDNPEQIHNLDYSNVAIEVGKKREASLYNVESISERGPDETKRPSNGQHGEHQDAQLAPLPTAEKPKPAYMRWSAANLLDHTSLLGVCERSAYSVIIDKSTSDSIACSDDVCVPLPYQIGTFATPSASEYTNSPAPVHPLHVLAIHMALLVKPGAKWISLSYSMDRYPFVDLPSPAIENMGLVKPKPPPADEYQPTTAANGDQNTGDNINADAYLDDIPQGVIDSGLPDPGMLWKLEGKYEIEVPPQEPSAEIHRPKVLHWVYVLVRTDVKVFVRDIR